MANDNLEGTIKKEGDLLIGTGNAGLNMFDDTMKLGITKTIKHRHLFNSTFLGLLTIGIGYLANDYDSLYLAAGAGSIATFAGIQIKEFIKTSKEYTKTLNEAVEHGWASKEELKKIDSRYIY